MASFSGQPNELLIRIVGHLRDRRINFFDPVATKDLQSVRLVSHRMSAIATSMLFENMVYDLKFYRKEDVNRLANFAQSNPRLVNYVHRLQFKMPPGLENEWLHFSIWMERRLRGYTTESNYWTEAQALKVHDVSVESMRPWVWGQMEVHKHNSPTQNITKVLPSLRHIENGLSTHCEQKLAEIEYKFFVDEGINIPQDYRPPGHEQDPRAIEIILKNMTEITNSLKLRKISCGDARNAAMIPWHLQHLDLELPTRVKWKYWRQSLRRLRQLQTLRLGLPFKFRRATEYEEKEDPDSRLLYIDDLLVNPNNPEDDCFFPELTSLELVDCTLRISGLLKIAENRQKRVRKLILTGVTVAPKYSGSWRDIADMCKGALPGLKYLRLTKVVTSPPIQFQSRLFVQDFHGKIVPEGWRSGLVRLEDAMTYEWTRGDMDGIGHEFIGSKCPWTRNEKENELE